MFENGSFQSWQGPTGDETVFLADEICFQNTQCKP
jgi:hypothetical protein